MDANAHSPVRTVLTVLTCLVITSVSCGPCSAASSADGFYAVYVPAHKITQRTLDEIVHYAAMTPVNAVVLHVKTPTGQLLWPSKHAIARQLGVSTDHAGLARHVSRLKKDNIHTIAKLDVFADHQLAACLPELSVVDASKDTPWTDANGLHWSNPSDSRVWAYNIALSTELAAIGFDEIQFDYVRFPSDGDLSIIRYPNATSGFSKSDCIQSFLRQAYESLKPLGVSISADLFGLTAWKRTDFGIGQVLEKMVPFLDVICPMFYPSHFPSGFLGKKSPGDFPEMIMETSMRSMMRRTNKPIRPWVQGFWYRSEQIAAQIEGIENASGGSWSIWNPTGRYHLSYRAMADRSGINLRRPQFYPTMTELKSEDDRCIRGNRAVVNYTSFQSGYSILSLEAPQDGKRSRYASPAAVVATLAEGIMDHILRTRGVRFNRDAEPYTKRKLLSDLLCSDLGKDARQMRPGPIYIDWAGACTFRMEGIPKTRLDGFAQVNRQLPLKAAADNESLGPIKVAVIPESMFEVVTEPAAPPQMGVFSR